MFCGPQTGSIQDSGFDAHAHLPPIESFSLPENWRGVVCAVRESEFERLATLAERLTGIIPAFGLHPWFLRERSENYLDAVRRLLEKIPRAQVGEIGLDNIRSDSAPPDEQENIFCQQIRLAAALKRPATVHCVRAWNAMLHILRREKALPRLHFHAFSGSPEIVRELLKIAEVSFSFSPRQLKSRSEKIRRALESVPPELLFEESDAPLGST